MSAGPASASSPGSSEAAVITHVSDGVATIVLNRPDRLNLLDVGFGEALLAAFGHALADEETRVVALVANGRTFMGGADLKTIARDFDHAPEVAARVIDLLNEIVVTIRGAGIPVICGVHGSAAGGGLSLALACDMIVCGNDARLVPAYMRIGSTPDGGMTWSLAKAMGQRRAFRFLVLGEPMMARDALHLGLVDDVVPDTIVRKTVETLAVKAAKAPREATKRLKKLIYANEAEPFQDRLVAERESFMSCARTQDFREGVNAFLDQRSPDFR